MPSMRSDCRISVSSLFLWQSAVIAPLCRCASSGFQLPWDGHPPNLCWVIPLPWVGAWEVLPCSQSSLPALALSLEEQQTLRSCCRSPGLVWRCSHQPSGLLCCHCHPRGVRGHDPCHHSLSADPAHRGHLSVCATALRAERGCVVLCALPPSSGTHLDVKVKLQHQRIDFSEPRQGDMLIARLGIFLHVSPHKHTLIKYSLEHKKCFR